MSSPLPLQGRQGHLTVAVDYFFNNDLEFLKTSDPEKTTIKHAYDKDAEKGIKHWGKRRKLCVSVKKLHGYDHLEEIMVKRADRQLHKFKEGDFVDLHLNDIKDMLLLAVQHKLFHLNDSDIIDFIMDLQLYTPSYKPPGVIYEYLNKKRVMRADELYKFSDGTLRTVRVELHHRIIDFRLGYNDEMSSRKWMAIDKRRSELMVELIDKHMQERRIIRNLERLVGARELEMNYKLMTRIQFEKLVNASRAKKLEKSHDPLALVVHTSSSSRNTSSFYVTHPTSVVDYDNEYQQDDVQTNYEDPLASAILLLGRAITQNFSNPTNNCLRTSSNTRNQTIIQGDRVNIQIRNSGNTGRNTRRAYVQEEVVEGSNAQNETENVQRTLRTSIQPANNTSDVGSSYDSAFICEVQSSSINENKEHMYPIHTKIMNSTIGDDQIDSNIIFYEPNGNVNSGSVKKDTHVPDLYALEQLARNAYKEAKKQQLFAQKV
ncbi:hypothetical protein Tco_0525221 [Tanacetum coccineum]